MGIFDKFKTSTAIDRLSEEKLYEQVAQELKAGKKREGIWVKAMAKSGGDLNKAESMYIELRVQAIKDELHIQKERGKYKEELEEELFSLDNAKEKVKGTSFDVIAYTGRYKVWNQNQRTVEFDTLDLHKLHSWLDIKLKQ
jgi:hypothetical protein